MHYRLYSLDAAQRIRSGVDLDCENDTEALALALKLLPDFAKELWRSTVCVAVLPKGAAEKARESVA